MYCIFQVPDVPERAIIEERVPIYPPKKMARPPAKGTLDRVLKYDINVCHVLYVPCTVNIYLFSMECSSFGLILI